MLKKNNNKLKKKFLRIEKDTFSSSQNARVPAGLRELSRDESRFFNIIESSFNFCEFTLENENRFLSKSIIHDDLEKGLKVALTIKQKLLDYSLVNSVKKVVMNSSLDGNKFVLVCDLIFINTNANDFSSFPRDLIRSLYSFLRTSNGNVQCLVENFTKTRTTQLTLISNFELSSVIESEFRARNSKQIEVSKENIKKEKQV